MLARPWRWLSAFASSALTAAGGAELISLLLAALVAAAAPLDSVDEAARSGLLGLLPATEPSREVFLLTLDRAVVADETCGSRLAGVLADGRARSGLFWSGAGDSCLAPTERLGPPVIALDPTAVSFDASSRVTSFRARGRASEVLGRPQRWAARTSRRAAVPGARFADLGRGDAARGMLEGRVVVAAAAFDERSQREAEELAAVIAATLDGSAVPVSPRWANAFVGAAAAAAFAAFARRAKARTARSLAAAAAITSLALVAAYVVLGASALALVPVGSLVAATFAAGITRLATRAYARRGALGLTEQIALRRLRAIASDGDPARSSVGSLAEAAQQLFPCERALIGVVGSGASAMRLRFWGPGGDSDRDVVERRRDVRRPPFSAESGAPAARLVRGLVGDPATPAVVVTLVAVGEIEGCLILCGEAAERAHLADPERAARVGLEIASRLRVLRLTLHREAAHADPLLEGVRLIVDDAELLERAFWEVPAAVMVADSGGDVRRIGRAMVEALEAAGASLPRDAGERALPPRTLAIDAALGALTGLDPAATAAALESAMHRADGAVVPGLPGERDYVVRVRPLKRQIEQVTLVSGWVLVLTATETRAAEAPAGGGRTLADSYALAVHPSWDFVANAVDAAIARSGLPVRIASARVAAHVISQRALLAPALAAFLSEAARQAPPGQPPVVTLRERSRHVEVAILDLNLGLPREALQRVLDAPGAPPRELETLGNLLRAVEASQGTARLRGAGGWGAHIVLSLLRAKGPVGPISAPAPVAAPATAIANAGRGKRGRRK